MQEVFRYYILSFFICCCFLVVGMLVTMKQGCINKNESSIEVSTETKSLIESQLVKSSNIKAAILNKYPNAEIISNDKSNNGYFIYQQEKYSYELDDNILFINRDNKIVDYLYVN